MRRVNRWTCRLAVAAVGLSSGCSREGVHAYSIPKEARPSAPPAGQPQPGSAASSGAVVWSVPDGWRSVASDQPMRIATFRAGAGDGVEVTVAAFPGDAGGLLANVNRWRGQLGMEPTNEQDLAGALRSSKVGPVEVRTIRLAGPKGQDMLGAIVNPGDGKTWFVKATAAPDALTAIAESFSAFAGTFRLEAGGAAEVAAVKPRGDGMSESPPMAPALPPSADPSTIGPRLATFQPPTNWTPEESASGILAAAFNAANADGGARITATSLFNDGGGTLANINRWRGQLELPPVASLDQQATTDLGKGAVLVDLSDAAGGKRMVAAIVPDGAGGQTWFFKLTGGVKGAGAERSNFDRFVRQVGMGEP